MALISSRLTWPGSPASQRDELGGRYLANVCDELLLHGTQGKR